MEQHVTLIGGNVIKTDLIVQRCVDVRIAKTTISMMKFCSKAKMEKMKTLHRPDCIIYTSILSIIFLLVTDFTSGCDSTR